VLGRDVLADPGGVRRSIGVALQEVGLDDLQTGREVLTLQAALYGIRGKDARRRVDELLEVVTLSADADRRLKGYSGGMRRRLDLACALVHNPRLIFLDEPTTGLDPITREAVWQYVSELNAQGVTFFLTTQYLEEADRLCHDIAIMDAGKIVVKGSPAELKAAIGADAITLTFVGGAPAALKAEPVLRALPRAEDVRVAEAELVLYIRDGSGAVSDVVHALDDVGLTVASLKLTHPTLDDVFLRSTGHHLRAEQPTEGAA
jgi:ABC-2 type transport system ATP-binding protein